VTITLATATNQLRLDAQVARDFAGRLHYVNPDPAVYCPAQAGALMRDTITDVTPELAADLCRCCRPVLAARIGAVQAANNTSDGGWSPSLDTHLFELMTALDIPLPAELAAKVATHAAWYATTPAGRSLAPARVLPVKPADDLLALVPSNDALAELDQRPDRSNWIEEARAAVAERKARTAASRSAAARAKAERALAGL